MRDPRYDILFEPVQIGPVTARNRFYQVPHCNGMGYRDPSGEAYMRRIKAEGGWGVVCTEEVEIHPTSDLAPYVGQSVRLRFHVETDSSVGSAPNGWYVDDVKVEGCTAPDALFSNGFE